MTKRFTRRLGLLAVTAFLAACSSMPGQSGWTSLVDGANGLDNFDRIGDANWRAEGAPSSRTRRRPPAT